MTSDTMTILDRHGVDPDAGRRVEALRTYDVLDTPREADFDDLARMASEICGTPVALVSLVSQDRQFFKAELGFGIRETGLDVSFCRYGMLGDEVMVVSDATRDERFRDNSVVTEGGVRFYAGAPLRTPAGLPIGTLCVIDYEPRDLDDRQRNSLQVLARQVVTQLELRRLVREQAASLLKAQAAEQEKAMLARIVEQAGDFIAMADANGIAFFVNDAGRRIVGIDDADIGGTKLIDYFVEEDRAVVLEKALPAVRTSGYWEGELRFRNFRTDAVTPVLYNIFPLRDAAGGLVGYGTVAKDVTAQKAERLRRADITREMSHRMKNTLAIVQAIVNQTLRNAVRLEEASETISSRLSALARAQDVLTATGAPWADIRDVVDIALSPHRSGASRGEPSDAHEARFIVSGPSIRVTGQQGLGLSLALHELATNAAKYGALSNDGGVVTIEWSLSRRGEFAFAWRETGGPKVTAPSHSGFGSRLMERMVAPYFDGRSSLAFDEEGVRFRLTGSIATSAADLDEA